MSYFAIKFGMKVVGDVCVSYLTINQINLSQQLGVGITNFLFTTKCGFAFPAVQSSNADRASLFMTLNCKAC